MWDGRGAGHDGQQKGTHGFFLLLFSGLEQLGDRSRTPSKSNPEVRHLASQFLADFPAHLRIKL